MSDDPKFKLVIDDLIDQLRADTVILSGSDPDVTHVICQSHRPPKDASTWTFELNEDICPHVASMNHPLVVDDAQSHPLLKMAASVREKGVGAYAGYPVAGADGRARAVLSAAHDRIHPWSEAEKRLIWEAAHRLSIMLAEPNGDA